MRTRQFMTAFFSAMAIIILSFQTTSAEDSVFWNIVPYTNDEAILEPGTTTYCEKDFSVTNMGKEEAHVQIIFDNGDSYWFERYPGNHSKSYKMESGTPFSTNASKGHKVKGARIVNATAGKSNIKIRC